MEVLPTRPELDDNITLAQDNYLIYWNRGIHYLIYIFISETKY